MESKDGKTDSSKYEGHTKEPLQIGFSDGSGGGGHVHEGTQEQYESNSGYFITTAEEQRVVVRGGSNDGSIAVGILTKADAELYRDAPDLLKQRDALAEALRAIVNNWQGSPHCDIVVNAQAALAKLT